MDTTNPTSCQGFVCSIIPPHLLEAIANSEECDEETRSNARRTLDHTLERHRRRNPRADAPENGHQGIIPDHVLSDIMHSDEADESTRQSAAATLDQSQAFRNSRKKGSLEDAPPDSAAKLDRVIYDMRHSQKYSGLPGFEVRDDDSATQSKDPDVNACWDNFGHTWEFYNKVLGRNSIDDKGMEMVGSVHYGNGYANAFWDDGKSQMAFGDGNTFLYHFCQSLDVIGHELTHGVTHYTAQLEYQFQSGALNESVSDVFGSVVKQYFNNETAEQADWLIGEDCIFPGVKGVALRSMRAPGTAYNDPRIGRDQQPDRMSKYMKMPYEQDAGGVHYNSGIPNRAFYLSAVGLGGYSWDKAARIWYAALTSPHMTPNCNFQQFAHITCSLAKSMFGADEQEIVRKAWVTVEVLS